MRKNLYMFAIFLSMGLICATRPMQHGIALGKIVYDASQPGEPDSPRTVYAWLKKQHSCEKGLVTKYNGKIDEVDEKLKTNNKAVSPQLQEIIEE